MPNDDTGISLREYFDARWDEQNKRLDERWAAQQEARTLALEQVETRLEHLNDLRSGVLTREEYEDKHTALISEVARLYETHNRDVSQIRERLANLDKAVAVGPNDLPELRNVIATARGERQGHVSTVTTTIAIVAATSGWAIVVISLITKGFTH